MSLGAICLAGCLPRLLARMPSVDLGTHDLAAPNNLS
jgi:hypothetical protein